MRYIGIICTLLSLISCRNSNSEVVVQSKEYLKYNDWFLMSMIDEIEKIPNLRNEGHTFIKNSKYRNEWSLRYWTTKDKNDTVQIDKAIVSKWIYSGLVSDFEYDIVNRIAYFKLDIENKNGYSIVLVHQQAKINNSIKLISDTSKFNALGAFKYQLDDNWLMFSPKDWSISPFVIKDLHE